MSSSELLNADWVGPEDLASGIGFTTYGRTVTESDIVGFAGLTGDWNPQHTNREWMRPSPFGERIAHGLLVSSIAIGAIPQRVKRVGPISQATAVFKRPVQIGDTIRVEGRPARPSAERPAPAPPGGNEGRSMREGGALAMDLRILNQDDQLTAKMKVELGARQPVDGVERFGGDLRDSLELTPAEIAAGTPYRTPGRTITEAHLVGFSAITGDWAPSSADAEWAREHGEGARTAQEMLLISTSAALIPLDVPRLMAARRSTIAFHAPVFVGDTVHIEGRFAEGLSTGEGSAQEIYLFRMVNQRGELVVSLMLNLLMEELDAATVPAPA